MEHLTDTDFKGRIHEGNTIVDFWAEWCGPCKMLGPIFEELSKDKDLKHIKFAKLNVDEAGDIAAEHSVRGIPTMVLFKDGEEIHRIVGFTTKEALKKKIQDAYDD